MLHVIQGRLTFQVTESPLVHQIELSMWHVLWQVPSGEPRLLVQQLVSQQALSLKEEYGYLEKDMSIDIYDHPQRAPTVMTVESQTKLLTLLSTLPHGVVKWSHAVPGRTLSCCMMISTWDYRGHMHFYQASKL